jgi:hypothetical protein
VPPGGHETPPRPCSSQLTFALRRVFLAESFWKRMIEGKMRAGLSLFNTGVSQSRGSLHVTKMRRNGFRCARKYFRIRLTSTMGV